MPVDRCRVCNQKFFTEPLLHYKNMPGAAQYLPSLDNLTNDKGVDLEVCQCSGCGLVQLSNDPVPYYREVIRASAFSTEMTDFRQTQFGEFVRQFDLTGKKVLEIGCGRGEYLSLMQTAGSDAYGLEYSAQSVQICLENALNVSQGFIESRTQVLDNAPFDAFINLNFLEHLPDLNTVLGGIHHNLAADAVGLVEVPNFDMMLRDNLFSEFIGDHLFYFTADTLRTALTLNGFEVLSCREVWHSYIISATVRKRERLDISRFYHYQTQLKNEIERYLARFGDKKVAVWGAGHQALAVLSMSELAGKICYVVDSAPFKQGKYTPATHIPIVPPDALETDPVEAIIVMAASYSDEVTGIIRQRFDSSINVAILREFGLEEV